MLWVLGVLLSASSSWGNHLSCDLLIHMLDKVQAQPCSFTMHDQASYSNYRLLHDGLVVAVVAGMVA